MSGGDSSRAVTVGRRRDWGSTCEFLPFEWQCWFENSRFSTVFFNFFSVCSSSHHPPAAKAPPHRIGSLPPPPPPAVAFKPSPLLPPFNAPEVPFLCCCFLQDCWFGSCTPSRAASACKCNRTDRRPQQAPQVCLGGRLSCSPNQTGIVPCPSPRGWGRIPHCTKVATYDAHVIGEKDEKGPVQVLRRQHQRQRRGLHSRGQALATLCHGVGAVWGGMGHSAGTGARCRDRSSLTHSPRS